MASVVETKGQTPLGQRDSERLPVSGNDKTVSGNGKTRDATVGDPVSAGPIIRMPRAERIFPRLASRKETDPPWRRKLSTPMFSIAIVLLIILFPVLIPAAVTAVHVIAEAGQRRLGDGVGSNGGQSVSHEHTRLAAVA
jgi:hypothetical protein